VKRNCTYEMFSENRGHRGADDRACLRFYPRRPCHMRRRRRLSGPKSLRSFKNLVRVRSSMRCVRTARGTKGGREGAARRSEGTEECSRGEGTSFCGRRLMKSTYVYIYIYVETSCGARGDGHAEREYVRRS